MTGLFPYSQDLTVEKVDRLQRQLRAKFKGPAIDKLCAAARAWVEYGSSVIVDTQSERQAYFGNEMPVDVPFGNEGHTATTQERESATPPSTAPQSEFIYNRHETLSGTCTNAETTLTIGPPPQDDLVKRLQERDEQLYDQSGCGSIDHALIALAADQIQQLRASEEAAWNNSVALRAENERLVQEQTERIKGYHDDLFAAHARIKKLVGVLEAIDKHRLFIPEAQAYMELKTIARSGKGERCDEVTARIRRVAPELAAARATISRRGK